MEHSAGELIGKFFERFDGPFIVKWAVPFLACLAAGATGTLLHPPHWLGALIIIPTFSEAENKSLSIAFLVAVLVLLLYIPFTVLYWATHLPKPETPPHDPMKTILDDLPNLSDKEQILLAICLRRNSQTFTSSIAAPIVQHLLHRGMITFGGTTGYQERFPFMIAGPIWTYLKEHPEVLTSNWVKELPKFSNAEVEKVWNKAISDGLSLVDI